MPDKFNSFGDLDKIKNKFSTGTEPASEIVPNEEKSEPKVENKESFELQVGDIISSYGNYAISSAVNEKGSIYTRINPHFASNAQKTGWFPVMVASASPGLFVFLDKKPELGDTLKITKVSEKYAIAEVIK